MTTLIQGPHYEINDNGTDKILHFKNIKKNNYEKIFEDTLNIPIYNPILQQIRQIEMRDYVSIYNDLKIYETLIKIIDNNKDKFDENICIKINLSQIEATGQSIIKSDKVYFNFQDNVTIDSYYLLKKILDYFPNIFAKLLVKSIIVLHVYMGINRDNQLIVLENDENDFDFIKKCKNSLETFDKLIMLLENFLGKSNNKLLITTKLNSDRIRHKKIYDYFFSKLGSKLRKFITNTKLVVTYEITGVKQDLDVLIDQYENSEIMINTKLHLDKSINISNTYTNNITEINQIYDIFIKRYYSSLIEKYHHKILNNANITDELKQKANDYIDSIFTYIFKDVYYKTHAANNSHIKIDYVKKMINYVIKYRESVKNNSFPFTKNFLSYHGLPTNNIVKLPNDCLLFILTPLNRFGFQDTYLFQNVLLNLQSGKYNDLLENPLCYERNKFNDILTDATVVFGGQYYFDINLVLSTEKHEIFYNQNGIYSSTNKFKRNKVICGNLSTCIRENNLNGIIILHCCRSIDDLPIEDSILMYRYEHLIRILNKSVYLPTEQEYIDCDKITSIQKNTMIQPKKLTHYLNQKQQDFERNKYIIKISKAKYSKLTNNSQSISLGIFKRLNIPNADKFVELINKIGSINNKDIFDELDILTNLKSGDPKILNIYANLIDDELLFYVQRIFNGDNFLTYIIYNIQYFIKNLGSNEVSRIFNSLSIVTDLILNNLNIDQTQLENIFNLNTAHPLAMKNLRFLHLDNNTFQYLPVIFLDLGMYESLQHISCNHINFNNTKDLNVVNYNNLSDNFANYFNIRYTDGDKFINKNIVIELKKQYAMQIDLNINKLKLQMQTHTSRKTKKQNTKNKIQKYKKITLSKQ
jgi:hypothetical protein